MKNTKSDIQLVFLIHTELRCTVNHTSDLQTYLYTFWNFFLFSTAAFPSLTTYAHVTPSKSLLLHFHVHIPPVHFFIIHPPKTRSSYCNLFLLLLVFLPVTSLLSLHHPFLLQSQPLQSTHCNYSHNTWRFNFIFSLNCGFSIPLWVRKMEYFIGLSLHNNMVQCFYYATNN